MTRVHVCVARKKKVALAALDRTPMWETTFPRLTHNTRRMQMPDVMCVLYDAHKMHAFFQGREYSIWATKR